MFTTCYMPDDMYTSETTAYINDGSKDERLQANEICAGTLSLQYHPPSVQLTENCEFSDEPVIKSRVLTLLSKCAACAQIPLQTCRGQTGFRFEVTWKSARQVRSSLGELNSYEKMPKTPGRMTGTA